MRQQELREREKVDEENETSSKCGENANMNDTTKNGRKIMKERGGRRGVAK